MKKGFRIIKFKKDKPVLQIKKVSKAYNGRPILKNISMDLFPGECVGLLGPNGSGKSTIICWEFVNFALKVLTIKSKKQSNCLMSLT